MSAARPLIRAAITIVILALLMIYVTPKQAVADLRGCDWRWIALTVLLAPVFLACRVWKWMLLERQTLGSTTIGEVLPRYLRGMAAGLVTPGRVGELARLRAPLMSAAGSGLFFLEKAIEITCLLSLCAVAAPALKLTPTWSIVPIGISLVLVLLYWRRLIGGALAGVARVFKRPTEERRRQMNEAVSSLRIRGVAGLSLACFVLYIAQAYCVLRALGVVPDFAVVLAYPLVLLANLAPITVGGYGVREALAVFVLQAHEVAPTKAAASTAIVTFFDLVIPGLCGVLMFKFRPGSTQAASKETNERWDDFWDTREKRLLGRIVGIFRRRFVTTKLARYIRDNTEKGTLVEAGCGSGEITLRVAAERGDRAILVDYSRQALEVAERLAQSHGVEAKLVECDITELSEHVPPAPENTVFNIGVVEHFRDPKPVLREMARSSGRNTLAIIPERSVFWLVYFHAARLLGLVPTDFFVQFFNRKQLADLVAGAGMEIHWMRRAWVLGLIPYLGVCYSPAQTADSGELS